MALLIILVIAVFVGCSKDVEPSTDDAARGNQNTSQVDPKILLGKKIFNDPNLSVSEGGQSLMVQSCASCHIDGQGFAGFGDKAVQIGSFTRSFIGGFAEGAVAASFGRRMPPSAAYATFSPLLHLPAVVDGVPNTENEFFGGLFWDGRATGHRLGSLAAEQAQGPFLNPVEQNHPSSYDVLLKIEQNLNGYYN